MASPATGASLPLWLARGGSASAKAAEQQPAAKRPCGRQAAGGPEPEAKSRRRGKAPDAAACAALPAPAASEEKAPPAAAQAKAKPRARGKAKAAPQLPTPEGPAAPKEPAAPEGKGKGKGKGGPPSTGGGHNAPGEDIRERVKELPKVSPAEKVSFTSVCMGLRLHFEQSLERRHKQSSIDSYILTFQLLFKRDSRSFATMASKEYWSLIKVSTSNKKHHGIESAAITHFANFYAARAEQCDGEFKVDPKWGALLYNPGARSLPLIMKTRPSPPPAVAKTGPKMGQSGDDEMMALTQRVPIVDPISLCRIEVPVRGKNCEHLQVFDRKPYIEFNQFMENKGTSKLRKIWNCPICQKVVQEKDLVLDEKVAKVLEDAKVFPALAYVECLPCGTLALPANAADMVDEQDEDSDEEETGPLQDVTKPSNQGGTTASIMSFFAKTQKESSEAPGPDAGAVRPPTPSAPTDPSPRTPPKAPEAQGASPAGASPVAATPPPVKLAAGAKGAGSPAGKAARPAVASEPAPVVAELSMAPADFSKAMPLKVNKDAASTLDAFAFVAGKPGEALQKAAATPPQPVAQEKPTSDPEQQAKKRSREDACFSPAAGGNLLKCFSRERPSPKEQKQPSPAQHSAGKACPAGSEAALPAWDEKAAVVGVSADLQSSFQKKLDSLQSLACTKPRFS